MNQKKLAAEKAVEQITDGMIVGLGTGSTAAFAIDKIGQRVREGLTITAVPTSERSDEHARRLGIPIIVPDQPITIDITIDGADQVDSRLNLIKGGGGSLLREKIVAYNSSTFIVVVDESKLVKELTFPLPVEIIPFATALTLRQLRSLGCSPSIRKVDGQDFITDNGHLIADCPFDKSISDPETLSARLKAIPGVVETGLFLNTIVSSVLVGRHDGTVAVLGAVK